MNYPEDNYDDVHQAIVEERRPEWLTWKERKAEQTETEKKHICQLNINRLERMVAKL